MLEVSNQVEKYIWHIVYFIYILVFKIIITDIMEDFELGSFFELRKRAQSWMYFPPNSTLELLRWTITWRALETISYHLPTQESRKVNTLSIRY
jgi:hypothetical protein